MQLIYKPLAVADYIGNRLKLEPFFSHNGLAAWLAAA
jgi:hypothetical protein